MSRRTESAGRPVEAMTSAELDRHLDLDHDRDSGERGIGHKGAIREHENLHRHGVWRERPHNHGGTLPFGDARPTRRLRRLKLFILRALVILRGTRG